MSNSRTNTVVLRPEPEGGFTVRVPALPEVVTYGEGESEALAIAREASELAIEVRQERGEEIPEPQTTSLRRVSIAVAA